MLDSIVYSDSYKSYDSLDVSGFHHFRINHQTDFALGANHINGIENFWSQAKRILRKYNGIPKENLRKRICDNSLFLSECQFRFNYGDSAYQLKTLRKWTGV